MPSSKDNEQTPDDESYEDSNENYISHDEHIADNSSKIEEEEIEYLDAEPSDEKEDDFYRKRALQQMGTPDQLDKLFTPAKEKTLVLKGALFLLLASLFVWLFFGSIPIIVQGAGIFMNKQGLFSIQSKATGNVVNLLVQSGQSVKKGQVIALIEDPQENYKYQYSVANEKKITESLNTLKAQVHKEAEGQKEAIEKQISTTEATIKELEESIIPLKIDFEKKEALVKQNLISLKDLQDTQQLLTQRLIALETTKSNLVTFKAELIKGYRDEEIKQRERDLLQATQDRELLEHARHFNQVLSPDNGRVLEILVDIGTRIVPGKVLMHLEYETKNQQNQIVYAFVPVEIGKKIKKGTQVEIEPTTISSEEYGYILGNIVEVSTYAVSNENIGNMIQNQGLVTFLTKGNPTVIQLMIYPIIDPNTVSGFKWTAGKGPPAKISTGTVCQIKAVIERERPIYYFFPFPSLEILTNH